MYPFGMELVVFSGIQAAGKSTFFHERFATTHVRLSLDLLKTRNRTDILLFACFAAQQSMVIDDTNPTMEQRQRYNRLAKAAGFRAVLYFFEISIDQAVVRNARRPELQRIPEVGIRGTFAKLERPAGKEGFDQAFLVRYSDQTKWMIEELK